MNRKSSEFDSDKNSILSSDHSFESKRIGVILLFIIFHGIDDILYCVVKVIQEGMESYEEKK